MPIILTWAQDTAFPLTFYPQPLSSLRCPCGIPCVAYPPPPSRRNCTPPTHYCPLCPWSTSYCPPIYTPNTPLPQAPSTVSEGYLGLPYPPPPSRRPSLPWSRRWWRTARGRQVWAPNPHHACAFCEFKQRVNTALRENQWASLYGAVDSWTIWTVWSGLKLQKTNFCHPKRRHLFAHWTGRFIPISCTPPPPPPNPQPLEGMDSVGFGCNVKSATGGAAPNTQHWKKGNDLVNMNPPTTSRFDVAFRFLNPPNASNVVVGRWPEATLVRTSRPARSELAWCCILSRFSSALWWSPAARCRCGYTAGPRSLVWCSPQHHRGPWSTSKQTNKQTTTTNLTNNNSHAYIRLQITNEEADFTEWRFPHKNIDWAHDVFHQHLCCWVTFLRSRRQRKGICICTTGK